MGLFPSYPTVPAVPFEKIERRQPDGEVKEIDCPPIVSAYNKSMGAVDMHDQRREVYRIGRKSRRWWLPLFYYLLDVCVINSYLLYKLKYPDKNYSHRDFRIKLMQELSEEQQPRASKRQREQEEVKLNNTDTHSIFEGTKMGDCSVCSARMEKDGKDVGHRVRTKFKCLKCNVYVCPITCFNTHSS